MHWSGSSALLAKGGLLLHCEKSGKERVHHRFAKQPTLSRGTSFPSRSGKKFDGFVGFQLITAAPDSKKRSSKCNMKAGGHQH